MEPEGSLPHSQASTTQFTEALLKQRHVRQIQYE